MPGIDYPTTDKEWRAQDDARTLVQADLIKKDDARLSLAQEAAAKMAEREREEANAMQRVAGKKKTPDKKGPLKTRSVGTGVGSKVTKSVFNVFNKI